MLNNNWWVTCLLLSHLCLFRWRLVMYAKSHSKIVQKHRITFAIKLRKMGSSFVCNRNEPFKLTSQYLHYKMMNTSFLHFVAPWQYIKYINFIWITRSHAFSVSSKPPARLKMHLTLNFWRKQKKKREKELSSVPSSLFYTWKYSMCVLLDSNKSRKCVYTIIYNIPFAI